jgi:GDP-4-dehydro-6-deoxy-D-mannose reductase
VRVLVTGVGGFVGGHVVDFLAAQPAPPEIFGILRRGSGDALRARGATVLTADLEDAPATDAAIEAARPDRVIHLAGQSSVHRSWEDPAATLRANVHGLLNVLEALRRRSLTPRVLVVGSAEEYGAVQAERLPVVERTRLQPASPYAVSKVAQAYLARQYFLSHGIPVICTRTFHHTGPGRGEAFAESSFARQIAAIEGGGCPAVISVGNLDAVRDFTDVRDVVRAYWLLLHKGRAGETYNVCSGRGIAIGDVLQELLDVSGVRIEIRRDPDRMRPADIPAIIGNPKKLRDATGWSPDIPLRQTLADLLAHWRRQVQGTPAKAPASPAVRA